MTILYNCHTDCDQYRITKFDSLGNVESTYLCTETECECPAGQRPTCRHRQMLPLFLKREAVNTFWFYDFDRKGWVTNEPVMKAMQESMVKFEVGDQLIFSDKPPEIAKAETDYAERMHQEQLNEIHETDESAKAERDYIKPTEMASIPETLPVSPEPTPFRRRV